MIRLGCFGVRGRLGAYRDRELPPRPRARVEAHLARCAGCQAELRDLERLTQQLSVPAPAPPAAVWQAFWSRVRAGLEAPPPLPTWRERLLGPVVGHPRLALGSAVGMALALLALLAPWTAERAVVSRLERAVPVAEAMAIQSVEASQPGASVMVFTNADQQLNLIWVFGLDRT